MKKFKLTSEFIVNVFGVKLFRIEAIVDFGTIKKGEKGGFVEKEANIYGDAWVSGNAQVYGDAVVSGDAWVSGNAQVYGDAVVSGNARVYGNAQVSGGSWVYVDAVVSGNAQVYGDAWVSGNAQVYGDAVVSGNARVSGNAHVYGNAQVSGNAQVYGDAWVSRMVFTLNFVYNLSLTDNHISFGCVQKTVEDWITFLDSDEVIETQRNTDKFKLIEMSLRLAIEQHKQNNK